MAVCPYLSYALFEKRITIFHYPYDCSTFTMINQFKAQRSYTIWGYLAGLSKDPSLYSVLFSQARPMFGIDNVYLLAIENEVVFLCIDTKKCGLKELANETIEASDGKVYYCSGILKRISPVWAMRECGRCLETALKEKNIEVPKIHYVLLTDSHFINYHYVCDWWQENHVTVLPDLHELVDYKLETNNDNRIVGFTYMRAFIEKYWPHELSSFDSEATDIVRHFFTFGSLHQESKQGKNDEEDDDNDDDDELDIDFDDLNDDIDDDDDEVFDLDDDDDDEEVFPQGLVKLNNSTVRVQVLKPMENPREELNKLIGCKNIKTRIDELISLTKYNRMVCEKIPGAKPHFISLHSVFTGKPGTGKTTVCKIYGSLLKEAGVLSKGHVVVAGRSSFIGNFWGDEEKMVRELINMAQGGVLMIDEAYQLNSNNSNDPGKMVIPLFMDILADENQRDIAVVLCGYKKEMSYLLDLNPGLKSRFPNTFDFPDFSMEELQAITLQRVKDYQYKFTHSAWAKYKSVLNEAYQMRNPQTWGNARFVANLLDHIYLRHAQRCVKLKNPKTSRLLAITSADIESIEIPTSKGHIGF